MKGGVYQGETAVKYILGFNSFDTIGSGEWDCTPLLTDPNGDFEAFKMENMDWGDDDHGEILITHNPCYYNYFFGGRGEVKIEEKASAEINREPTRFIASTITTAMIIANIKL